MRIRQLQNSRIVTSVSPKRRSKLIGGVLVYIGVAFFLLTTGFVRASGSWVQTDWSAGTGTSTSNQYESASSVSSATSGQISLSRGSTLNSNSTFDANITGWNGANKTRDTGTKYAGAGAAKITPSATTTNSLNTAGSTAISTTNARRMDKADFNNDGLDDLVTSDGSPHTVTVYISDGSGGWATPASYATDTAAATYDITTADFNGDGAPDFAITYEALSTTFSVFINNGSGSSFTKTSYTSPVSSRICSIASGDFNNDSRMDLVFTCYVGSAFYVYLNDGAGSFPVKTAVSVGNGAATGPNVITLDFNGDGFTDIAQATGSNGCKWRLMLNNAGAGFLDSILYTLSPCGTGNSAINNITSGDANHDGYDDIAIFYRAGTSAPGGDASYVTIIFGASDGVAGSNANYSATFASSYAADIDIEMADVNTDGYDDILVSIPTLAQYSLYLNNGDGTFASQLDNATGLVPVDMTLADYNGDGKTDLAVLNQSSQTLTKALNNSGGDAMTQTINVGDTATYQLEAYAYTSGGAVTSSDAVLYANGQGLSTTYTSVGGGWYRLTASVTGANARRSYGVQAKPSTTVYVDDITLYKYPDSGTLTSAVYDLGYGGDWGAFSYTTSGSGSVAVKVRTADSSDMSDAPDFSTCSAIASGSDLTGASCVTDNQRYVQYEVALTSDSSGSAVLNDISIGYQAWDDTPPSINAANIAMKRVVGGAAVVENNWTNQSSPYFAWDAATDAPAGSGIAGYCLYLGQDQGSDPTTTKGLLGTGSLDTGGACQFAVSGEDIDLATSGYLASALTSSSNKYYLAVKAIDAANNVYGGPAEEFAFKFDNTPPTPPSFITAPSQFVSSKDATLTWPSSGDGIAADANSGIVGLQYRIGSGGTWYGDDHDGSESVSDLLANDGAYTTVDPIDYNALNEGNNIFYFRAWDAAGNISTNPVTTVLKLNTSSPSSPQSVTATPSTSTSNSFAFSWNAPASFTGSASNLTYCYTVNTLPTLSTCTYTAAGVTSLPAGAYATQPGDNTFYVVAKDEAGNINYATAASTTFTANTSAPGISLNLDVVDISVKATSNWRLALSWDEPDDVGAGVASYKVYRSTDNNNFTVVASTSGTSYIDGGLSSQDYYYKIIACDSANNCGAATSVVTEKPTGKYTTPAEIVTAPKVEQVSTRKATIQWSTDRNSDSRIQYGLISGQYFPTEAAISTPTTDHQVQLNNLSAGTTYYFRAKWTDEGGTGQTSEFTFRTAPAPVVKEVSVKATLSDGTVQFTSKDAAKVKVYYGKSDGFGGLKTINTSLSESKYSLVLDGLDDGSKYYYKLNALDEDGNEYEGNVYSFSTPPRPQITNLRFQPVADQPSSTQKVTWNTNVVSSSELSYGIGRLTQATANQQLTTSHEVTISGLTDDSTYVLQAKSRDANGNLATSDQQVFRTDLDTRPPKISDVVVDASVRGTGSEARGQVVVSWKTDEPSTSQVAYGEGSSGFLSSSTSEDAKLTTEHVVVVSDLSTSRVYHFEPRSFDRSRNQASGDQKVAIIGRASDNVLSIIFNSLQKIFGIK